MTTADENAKRIRSFVVRGGRMSRLQRYSYEHCRGSHCIPFAEETLDFRRIFGRNGKVILEIGFGNGEASVEIAKSSPDTDFIGIEVFKAGIGNILHRIESEGIQNLKVIEHDAVEVLQSMVPAESLGGIHLFFPDPWPKKKHHKRRIIQSAFVSVLMKALQPGGYIYFVTDWEDYARSAGTVFSETPGLVPAGTETPWRPETRFERKGLEKDRQIFELFYRKNIGKV